mmetsp:Transcript_39035/g.83204  ORF Transcript_39035/g.83204 Transcript_39035/m.83204 type:complete len:318 (+) Transcript_39035:416-1369(+)
MNAGPAMSTCSHPPSYASLRFSPMKLAAHEVCALARSLTEFFMSATLLLNSARKNSGAYGSGCTSSPERFPAATAAASTSSLLEMTPANFLPVAISCAPVRVAMSMTRSGGAPVPGSSDGTAVQWATPSASTRRPSASVLLISHVLPERKRRMSSLRNAAEPMAFSARQRTTCTVFLPTPMETAASKALSSAAAPPMSAFMPGIPSLLLSARPPVSYTIPLPTRHTVCSASSCTYESTASAGGSCAHLPTLYRPPYPLALSSSPRIISTCTHRPSASNLPAAALASSTKAVVVRISGGMSTSRAARRVPPAACVEER